MERLENGKARCKTCGFIFPWEEHISTCPLCCVRFKPDTLSVNEAEAHQMSEAYAPELITGMVCTICGARYPDYTAQNAPTRCPICHVPAKEKNVEFKPNTESEACAPELFAGMWCTDCGFVLPDYTAQKAPTQCPICKGTMRATYYEDATLVCRECGQEFVFSAYEQKFYAERGFSMRTKCKDCINAYGRSVHRNKAKL